MLVRVADDETDSWQRRYLLWRPLRVAAGDHDLCFGILAADTANRRTRVLIRARGNRAGVHHNYGGLRRSGSARHPALCELAFESGAVGLSGAAAEVLYIVSRHIPMVPQTSRHRGKANQRPRAKALRLRSGQVRATFAHQAVAAVLRDWKHSRQKTGRPCVGRKGTVVCFPHPEQVAWVSTLV